MIAFEEFGMNKDKTIVLLYGGRLAGWSLQPITKLLTD